MNKIKWFLIKSCFAIFKRIGILIGIIIKSIIYGFMIVEITQENKKMEIKNNGQ